MIHRKLTNGKRIIHALISIQPSSNYFTWGNIEFDAFLFINNSTSLIAIPYLENKYVGINNLYLLLKFEESNLNNFIKIVENEYLA